MSNHTPTPWHAIPDVPSDKQIAILEDDDTNMVPIFWVGVKGRPNKENAAFIVEACNNHEQYKRDHERVQELERQNKELRDLLVTAHKALNAINSFYGQGLEVMNWHMNGTAEQWDRFFEENGTIEAEQELAAVLEKKDA